MSTRRRLEHARLTKHSKLKAGLKRTLGHGSNKTSERLFVEFNKEVIDETLQTVKKLNLGGISFRMGVSIPWRWN